MKDKKIIEVAVVAPLDRTFYYTVPEEFSSRAVWGMKVTVPFGKRTVTGYIVGFPDAQALTKDGSALKLKDVKDIPDPEPAFSPDILEFYRWIADYYISPLGEIIKTALPPSKGKVKKERFAAFIQSTEPSLPMTPKEERVFSFIRESRKVSFKELNSEFNRPSEIIKRLLQKGVIAVTEEEVSRNSSETEYRPSRRPDLTEPQKAAFSMITEAMREGRFSPFLLHGVTGSGDRKST